MARKIIYALFIPLFLVVFVSAVNAISITTESAQTAITNPSIKLKEQMQLLQKQKNKDQRKKVLIEKIDTKLAKINQNQVTKFTEALVRFQGFLDKIKQSTTDTNVLADAAIAQTAIDTAKTALDIQTSKAYTIEIVDDATLKINAGTSVSQLRKDLTAVHKLIVEAKQAVQKLNTDRTLIKKEATSSAR